MSDEEEAPKKGASSKRKWDASPAGKIWPTVESMYRAVWYVRDRYGEEAVKDYTDWWGKELSEELRDMGVTDHFELAHWFANREKVLFGTEVEVDVSDYTSTITVRNCPRMACALEWKDRVRKASPATTITRDEYCSMCTIVYLKSPAEGLGFEHQKEFTKTGCVQAFNKRIEH
jgi:hypothetical protein